MNSAILAFEGLERRVCSLITNYPKGLSPAMKQVILLLIPSHLSSPLPPPRLAGGFNELAGKEKGDLEMSKKDVVSFSNCYDHTSPKPTAGQKMAGWS